jgi:hypothetical protein
MACEVKYNTSHHAGADADIRIRNRLRPSNDTANAESVTTVGHSPTRTVTSIHHSRVHVHGTPSPGEGDIHGHKRGVV